MKNKTTILILTLLLIIPFVCADAQTDYHVDGTGTFNSPTMTTEEFSVVLDTLEDEGAIIPAVVTDLNEDGQNEIIVADNNNIRIYLPNLTTNQFVSIDAYDTGARLLTKFVVNSMNGSPVIYYVTNDNWHMLSWDGSTFTHANQTQNFDNGFGGFGCGDDFDIVDNRYCFYYTYSGTGASADMHLYSANMTNSAAITVGDITVNTNNCVVGEEFTTNSRPELRGVATGDTDNDGLGELYFTWGAPCGGGTYDNRVILTKVDSDLTTVTENIIDHAATNPITCYAEQASGTYNFPFTMPLIHNIDLAAGNGLEIVAACITDQTNGDDYKAAHWTQSLTIQDDYPEGGIVQNNVESTLISNIFLTDCFLDTGVQDLGILGYDEDEDEVDLLCINRFSSIASTTREFCPFSVSDASVNSTLTYAADMSIGAKDALITPFGVLGVFTTSSVTGGICTTISNEGELLNRFAHARGGVTIPVTFNDNPLDLLVITPSNMFYIDDAFTNSNPSFTYEIDPCNPISTNETVVVKMTVTDIDDDDVRVKIIAYEGEPNEQDSGWTALSASGTLFTRTFIANESTSSMTLRMIAEDDNNESLGNTTQEETIIVNSAVNSHLRGECTETGQTEPVTEEQEAALDTSFVDGITNSASDLGLTSRKSRSVFAVIVIMFMSIGIILTTEIIASNLIVAAFAGSVVSMGLSYIFLQLEFITTFVFVMFLLIACLVIVLGLFGHTRR